MEGRPIRSEHTHLDVTVTPSFLGLYTQICLAFVYPTSSPLNSPTCQEHIISTLTAGLDKLSFAFPWLAGQVVKDGSATRMAPLVQTPQLVVKDYTNDPDFPSMSEYQAAGLPFSMLDENLICPVNTLPARFAQGAAPIFWVQLNLVRGGMLLTFTAEHSTMDVTGQGRVIELLSKACNGGVFTEEELRDGNTDRRTTIKLIEGYQRGPELDHQIRKEAGPAETKASGDVIEGGELSKHQTRYVWAYWTFSSDSLQALKELATQSLSTGFVSTDDTITAFIWKLVSRARLARLAPQTKTMFARAIDARRFLGVSKTYIGLLNNMTYHTSELARTAAAPLGFIAADLRKAVDPETTTLEHDTRAFATAISLAEDKSVFSPVANMKPDTDISLSSWANLKMYELDFGFGLGKPVSVRRPRLGPVESLMYIMPRSVEGDSAVAVCLREEDMLAVRADAEFVRYARYVG